MRKSTAPISRAWSSATSIRSLCLGVAPKRAVSSASGGWLQHTACKLGQPLLYRGRRNLMPGSYSTDLRERVLVAVEAGEPADAVADEFMVGRSSVYRWMAATRDEGRRVAKPME